MNDGVYQYQNGKNSLFVPAKYYDDNEILSLTIDREHSLWIGVGKGVYKVDINSGQILFYYPTNSPVTSVTKDHENNYWITTLGKGVLLLPPGFIEINILNKSNRLYEDDVTSLKLHQKDSSLIFGVTPNRIYIRYKNGIIHQTAIDTNNILVINKLLCVNDDLWFITNNTNLNVELDYVKRLPSIIKLNHANTDRNTGYSTKTSFVPMSSFVPYLVTAKNVFLAKDNTLYILYYALIKAIIRKPNLIKYKNINLYPGKLTRNYAIKEDALGNIWFGGISGLGYYSSKSDSVTLLEHLDFESTITNIEILKNNTLLIGTSGAGLYVIKNNTIINHFQEANGLSSNTVNSIFAQNDNILWVGTAKGITHLTFKDTNYQQTDILYYGSKNNNPATYINDLLILKDTIFLATKGGLYYFNINKLTPQYNKPILKLLTPYNQDFADSLTFKLPYDFFKNVNQITFNFQAIAFLNGEEVSYHYQLYQNNSLVQEDTIVQKEKLTLPFSALRYGNYRLEINCWRNENEKSDKLILSFNVSPPIVLSWGAMVLYALIGSWLVYKITRYTSYKSRKRRELILKQSEENIRLEKLAIEAQQQKLGLEQEALRARIDPHFIFNCLNNLMTFVYEKNFEDLKTTIPRLARLIRNSLELGRHDFIDINTEKNYLNDYLLLEKMRFENKFNFSIEVSPGVPNNIKIIPPLMIQIFVENAIRHGFKNLPKGKSGEIKILFRQNKEAIECVVEDDGIGINTSKLSQSSSHISMGLDIVQKRISILNDIHNTYFRLHIYENLPPSSGTTIILTLPLKNTEKTN